MNRPYKPAKKQDKLPKYYIKNPKPNYSKAVRGIPQQLHNLLLKFVHLSFLQEASRDPKSVCKDLYIVSSSLHFVLHSRHSFLSKCDRYEPSMPISKSAQPKYFLFQLFTAQLTSAPQSPIVLLIKQLLKALLHILLKKVTCFNKTLKIVLNLHDYTTTV